MRRSATISIRPLVLGPGALGLLLVMACGIPSPSNTTTTTGETDAVDPDFGAQEGSGDGDGLESGGHDDDPVTCEDDPGELVPLVTRSDGGCSVVVRVHHETLTPLGWHGTCAALRDDALDEAEARALTDCCESAGTVLEPPEGQGLWVLHAAPEGGELGHVAIVSSHVGERVFEATIGRGEGTGDVGYPEAWMDPGRLGQACSLAQMPELASWDLVEGGRLDDERLRAVWGIVGSTVLPLAMAAVGEPRRAAVLRYPRRVDAFDPSTAEYVVVLESGVDDAAAPGD